MDPFKESFIEFAIHSKVLQLGEFVLKSGRISPYFFNVGLFSSGSQLQRLGEYYATALLNAHVPFDHLFGPAYKGLPLATATAIALSTQHQRDVTVTFNRKEVKDHGEGGLLMGAPLTGNVIMIDDVITAGTAFRSSQQLIQTTQGNLTGVIIALDRCERGIGKTSTLDEIKQQGITVIAIINFFDVLAYLTKHGQTSQVQALEHYHSREGVEWFDHHQ